MPTRPTRVGLQLLATFTFGLLLLVSPPVARAQLAQPVRTVAGLVSGVAVEGGVQVFRGVPFAAPPVGDLRWRAPQPAEGWSGVRRADRFAPGCIQSLTRSRPPWTEEFMHQGEVSEDCLYLNVWTGARSADDRRPVIVYLHGGGFNEGSGSVAVYDGAALARKGAVVVTINYRLGPFGFLAHPELSAGSEEGGSGNYGLKDQVASLRWVRDNIAAFGGDPGNVTIAGQSAGAISVYLLTVSPRARGLFHRAIVQSGPGALASFGVPGTSSLARPLAVAESAGVAFASARGASSLEELRALTVDHLTAPMPGTTSPRFGAVVDGSFLPAEVPALLRGGHHGQVPMIMGMNADEGSASAGYGRSTPGEFRRAAEERYGGATERFLSLYPAPDDTAAGRAERESSRDIGIVALGEVAAERTAVTQAPTYLYLLERGIPWPEHPEFGAFHTSEVPYVFGNLDRLPRPWQPLDRRISDVMSSYWVNFAMTGDPNGPGLPEWNPYRVDPDAVLLVGEGMEMRRLPGSERRRFLEDHLSALPSR